jgi:hypothetical protein
MPAHVVEGGPEAPETREHHRMRSGASAFSTCRTMAEREGDGEGDGARERDRCAAEGSMGLDGAGWGWMGLDGAGRGGRCAGPARGPSKSGRTESWHE